MARSLEQQFRLLITDKQHILICLPAASPSIDAIVSGIALMSILKKQGKYVKLVSPNFVPQQNFTLFEQHHVSSTVPELRTLVITLNLAHMGFKALHYEVVDDQLSFFITPERPHLEPIETFTSSRMFAFDLIITFDVQDLAQLDHLYQEYSDFFYLTPLVNIDHHPENEHFGAVNLIDITATSNTEILLHVLGRPVQSLDADLATLLLTGIISKTHAFRNRITQRSLAVTSSLVEQGARFSDIVHELYYKKSFTAIKLWGEILQKFSFDPKTRIVSFLIESSDFEKTSSHANDLQGLIEELMMHVPEASSILMVYIQTQGSTALLHVPHYIRLQAHTLFAAYVPYMSGHILKLTLPERNLQQAHEMIITVLRKHLNIS